MGKTALKRLQKASYKGRKACVANLYVSVSGLRRLQVQRLQNSLHLERLSACLDKCDMQGFAERNAALLDSEFNHSECCGLVCVNQGNFLQVSAIVSGGVAA